MSTFDLNLISLYRVNGQEWPLLPGLLVMNPRRKAARGREQDYLLVYLTLAGNVMFSSAEYAEITRQISEQFYNTSGSLTFALKAAVEALNAFLLNRNVKTTGQGQQSVAALVLAALRGNALYLVQSGPTHVYWMSNGKIRHFYDAKMAGRGLGLGQTAQMHFSQANLNPADQVLFCAALPPKWDQFLVDPRMMSGSLEMIRRRLLGITESNVSAVLIQFMEGNGAIDILRPSKEIPAELDSLAATAPQTAAPAGIPAASPPTTIPSAPGASSLKPQPRLPVEAPKLETVGSAGAKPVDRPLVSAPPQQPKMPAEQAGETEEAAPQKVSEPRAILSPEQRAKFKRGIQSTARFLAGSIQAGRAFSHKLSAAIEKLIPRLLPGDENEPPANLSHWWVGFIAIAIPILTLVIGWFIFREIGIPELYNANYQSAYNENQQTREQPDPVERRRHWNTALDALGKADQYLLTEDSQKLRKEVQDNLDGLDRIIRVDYKPAFTTRLRPMTVTHMAASDIDIYLLDDTTGSVIRGNLNGQSYDIDPGFDICKPGVYNGINVGPLIDIIALPRSNLSGASVIGIDAAGNLLYCSSGDTPKAATLQKPDVGWQHITAIAYDANNLYLLDAPGRAVWVFFGTPDIQFPDKPYFFFESQIPNGMEQAVGMTVNGDDLYLLHFDNSQNKSYLTTCTLSRIEVSPTQCIDPVVLVDTRPGRENVTSLADALFSQITFTSPPDPAVALLEPYTRSIFRFSARAVELQNQIRALPEQEKSLFQSDITAMAFSPNKVLFIFMGGQVYFAVNVP